MKYINADRLCEDLMNRWEIADKEKEKEIQSIMADVVVPIVVGQPSADVVEVETLKKNIEAYIDEARELRDEHSSELIRAFQQGRMFGHKCDLEMIKKGKKQNE